MRIFFPWRNLPSKNKIKNVCVIRSRLNLYIHICSVLYNLFLYMDEYIYILSIIWFNKYLHVFITSNKKFSSRDFKFLMSNKRVLKIVYNYTNKHQIQILINYTWKYLLRKLSVHKHRVNHLVLNQTLFSNWKYYLTKYFTFLW